MPPSADVHRFISAGLGNIRFTQTTTAFYILSLAPLTSNFIVDYPVPILEGDELSFIGDGNGTLLDWEYLSGGSGINVTVPDEWLGVGQYCWVLKISYCS